ncbi:MAG: FtsX-like permease family protein [Ilumatobacteraceae bacterium]
MKNVLARKGRLALTALAIIAGTTFLSGVFVFSGTIRSTFDTIFSNAFKKTDAYVRSTNKIDAGFDTTRDQIPDSLIATVQGVPGVKTVAGDVQGFAQMSTSSGKEIGTSGPPTFGSVYTGSPISPWSLADGRAATGGSEVVIDRASAKNSDVKVGDQISVTTKVGSQKFTVVGIARFAGGDTTGGATWALFDLPTAETFVNGKAGLLDSIEVGGDGSLGQQALADRIEQVVHEAGQPQTEVLTGKQITEENKTEIEKGLSFLTIFLSIFALIAIFVGSFIIFNVFSISAAQRQQENALLRAIGASRSQVTKSLLIEALVVGVGGSLIGFVAGIGLAFAILKILTATGFGVGSSSLVVGASGFVITVLVGSIVTMLCGIAPAIRSGRVPPLAAMRDVAVDRADLSRKRVITGVVFVLIAAAGIAAGLNGTTTWLGVGVVALFIALIALGPLVAGPIARLATPVLGKISGVIGAIAGRNAARNPKRIALTAGALGVGLSLLVGVATLGSSSKQSVRDQVSKQFLGDYTITTDSQGFGGLPTALADQVNTLPNVAAASGIGITAIKITEPGSSSPKGKQVSVVDPATAGATLGLKFSQGGWSDLGADGIVVSKEHATANNVKVGDPVTITFLDGTTKPVTVQAVYDSNIFGDYITNRAMYTNTSNPVFDAVVVVAQKPGASTSAVTAEIKQIVDQYPTAKFQTKADYITSQTDQVDTFLNFIYALLLMSVFIAILGIVITLLLSVYERRRELGLMRAVGTTRSQVAGSTVWESVLTALIGAVMGVVLGLVLGWVVVRALRDQGLTAFAVPTGTIIVFTILAIVVAVIAAVWPARRAAKSDILSAIATT